MKLTYFQHSCVFHNQKWSASNKKTTTTTKTRKKEKEEEKSKTGKKEKKEVRLQCSCDEKKRSNISLLHSSLKNIKNLCNYNQTQDLTHMNMCSRSKNKMYATLNQPCEMSF